MKNVILLSAVLFALSQSRVIVDADQALYSAGLYIVMGGTADVPQLVGVHLSMVPFFLAGTVIMTVLFAYLMEYIEKK